MPGVSPEMVVLNEADAPFWMNATWLPFGIAPLSAKGLPPAGFSPAPPTAVQPVMGPLPGCE